MKTQIIDIHPHVISDDHERYPVQPLGGKRSEWSKERPASFERLIEEMDEAGVSKAAIVHSSTTYGYDNSYVADCIAQEPERFTGVYAIDVTQPDAIEKIKYWQTRGMTGIRLFTGGRTNDKNKGEWLIDPVTFPVWEYAGEIGMTIVIQTKPTGYHMVETLLQKFPSVKVALDHSGRPELEDGPPYKAAESLFELAKYRNLYIKITPRTFELSQSGNATPETFFPALVNAFGSNHLAFGSNFPASPGRLKEIVAEGKKCLSCLSEEDCSWIWGKTAQVLYPALKD